MANDIVLCDVGKVRLLTQKLDYLRALICHLYVNNYTPVHGSILTDFTEASFPGYSDQTLSDFSAAYLNSFNQGETDTNAHIFTQTADDTLQEVYGWYATNSGGEVIMASRNPLGPVPMEHAGDVYVLLIQFLEDQIPIP